MDDAFWISAACGSEIELIMKNHYQSKGSRYIKNEIAKLSGAASAERLFDEANRSCDELLANNKASSKGEQMHLNMIAERVALYKVIKREYPEKAWAWVDELARLDSQSMRNFINAITSSKVLRRIFMPMMRVMTKRMFGNPAGFDQRIIESTKDGITFDLYACPYHKWCTKFGEPELTKNFCDADHHTYDNLPHFAFSRSETLGYGGEKCDFKYWLK